MTPVGIDPVPAAVAGPLRRAVRAIAEQDPDRARVRNGIGFSAADGRFGHAMARLAPASWTPESAREVWVMLRNYWAQLEDLGIEFDDLPEPPPTDAPPVTVHSRYGDRQTSAGRAQVLGYGQREQAGHIAMIRLEDREALVDSARDAAIIEAVKLVPGRKWLGNPPLWRVPIRSPQVVGALIDLANRFDMAVPDGFAATLRALVATDDMRDEPAGIFLDASGDVALVRTGLRPGAFEALEQLDVAAYDKTADRWRVPLSPLTWAALSALSERFELPFDADLVGRARALFADALRSYDEAVALAPSGRITEIPGMVVPEGKPLDPAQWAGIEYIVDHHSGALVGDEPGVSKTAQAYAALGYLGRKRIVWLCPAVAKQKMANEAHERFPHWQTAILDGRSAEARDEQLAALDPNAVAVVILNYEVLTVHAAALAAWDPDALVCDEAHRMKEEKTSWTKVVEGRSARRGKDAGEVGLAEQVRSRGGSVVLMTGTAMPNGPWDLISLIEILGWMEALGGRNYVARRFCGGRLVTVKSSKKWEFDLRRAEPYFGELNMLLRMQGMLRRRLQDVQPKLLKLPDERLELPLDRATMEEYRRAEQDIAAYMAERAADLAREIGRDPHDAAVRARLKTKMAEDAIELSTLRQLIGKAKVPATVEWVKEWLALNSSTAMASFDGEDNPAPGKIAIAAYHNDVVDALAEALGGVSVRGTNNNRRARERAMEAFQRDPDTRVIVCSILAAGEAIELTAAHTSLTVEYDWVPKTHIQWVGRCYRRGQARPVRPLYVHASGTRDEDQVRVLGAKRHASDGIIDGVAPGGQLEIVDVEAAMMDSLISMGESLLRSS